MKQADGDETIRSASSPSGTVTAGPSAEQQILSLLRGRLLIGVGLALLVVFTLLTALVIFSDPLAFDVPVTKELQEIDYGPFGWLMSAVSVPGYDVWNMVFPIVIAGTLLLFRRALDAFFVMLATAAALSAPLIKELVQRPRPTADVVHVVRNLSTYSFPSGHATEYTLVFGFCFYLAFTHMKPGALRYLALAFTGAMIVLVGPSRIWLGQHWMSDVLAGYTLGFGLLALVIWGYRGWQARIVKQKTGVKLESTAQI